MTEDERAYTRFGHFDDDDTVSERAGTAGLAVGRTTSGPRYHERGTLGRGGMGEVKLCRDTRIGRDVAVKVAPATKRFLREARVQAQLEHPSIVPVHDLELHDDGTAHLVMKRVRGQTLSQVVADHTLPLRSEAEQEQSSGPSRRHWPLRKLLEAFNAVCLAVDFAHSRGVVHRDLKPQNIMLGDFGEVVVLDWGIAKVQGDSDGSAEPSDVGDAVHTAAGSVMGTPGYFAPEQLDESLGAVGPRTDVYGLGAILFELLAKRPFIETRDPVEVALLTLHGGADPRPSRVAPDVPPALDDICAKALAREPAARFESARALHDAVDAHLAGEQDEQRRKLQSRAHTARAQALVDGGLNDESRARALSELGSALALDTQNVDARRALLVLLTTPPPTVPPEVRRRLDQDAQETVRVGARATLGSVAMLLPFLPLSFWVGMGNLPLFAVGSALACAAAAIMVTHVLRATAAPLGSQVLSLLLLLSAYAVYSRIAGPLVIMPGLLVGLSATMQTHPDVRFSNIATGASIMFFVVLFALEGFALVSPSYRVVPEGILIQSDLLTLNDRALLFLSVGVLGNVIAPSIFLRRIRNRLSAAELKVQLQAWQLEQLVAHTDRAPGR